MVLLEVTICDMIQLMIFKIYGPLLKMGSNFTSFIASYLFYLFLSRVAIENSKDLGRFSLWITREYTLPRKIFQKNIIINIYAKSLITFHMKITPRNAAIKLQSHIAGNHSICRYSGELVVDLPYSDIRFLGIYKRSMQTITNILKPKQS